MKLRDLNIGLQLRLGLGAILLFVAILGLTAWQQASSLWQETQGLYDHPFAVGQALRELKADVIAMHLGMKGLCLAQDDRERAAILQTVEAHEADALRQLQVASERYLGPRADVEAVSRALAQWRAYREESVRLMRAGQTAEVISRVNTGEAGGPNEMVMTPLRTMLAFADNRAYQFFQQAQEHKDVLLLRGEAILGIILLLSLAISYLLLRGIRHPLRDLTATVQAYQGGRLSARSRVAGGNEFGVLAASFNTLLDLAQEQNQRQENAAKIAEVMLKEKELGPFCRQLLLSLLELTDSQAGAVYLLDPGHTVFEHFHSIGLGGRARTAFSAGQLEGQFGPALASRRMQRITDIPADTPFSFATVGGDLQPREILTIPVLVGQEVLAMVCLTSLRGYQEPALALLEDIVDTLSARLGGVLAFEQISALAGKLEEHNRELELQKQELAAQTAELGEQNVELEMQKRQLDEANRLKSSFLANMSHELRTPLNSVIALAGVLHRRLDGRVSDEERGYLEVIARNGKHLLALINDILDLSRLEAGREEINLSRFSLRELADEVLALLEPQAREKNLALVSLVGGDLPPLRSDPAKCRHILQNLVGNAVKFTEAGRVEISASLEGQTVRVAVTDTGIGIQAQHLSQVFDEFRQADESSARKYGGTGLGLAIARKYATLLGGGIEVASTPGQGSTFSFWLPLNPDSALTGLAPAPYTPPERRATAQPPGSGQGRGILVVEDSEPAVIQLKDILTGEGYAVTVARDGRQALARIQAAPPDAVILDLMMPEVDGFQVLAAIRGNPQTLDLPVLILTAKHVTKEELAFLKGNNIQQLIQKGDISKTELLSAIARMTAPAPPEAAPQAAPAVILVADPDADHLATVKALLADAYTVITAGQDREVVQEALAGRPDLILLGIPQPEAAARVLEALKKEAPLSQVPVIALVDPGPPGQPGLGELLLARGFAGCLTRPVDPLQLQRAIREALHAD
jgi:signal transduction histidine kinase/CheY-like chemotaxis protein